MTDTIVYQPPGYTIWQSDTITEAMIQLLDATTWGTDGAVFDHLDTRKKILSIPDPTVIYMTDAQGLVAMAVLCRNRVSSGDTARKSYFIRYFAAHPRIQGQGIIKTFAEKVMGLLRDEEADPCIFFATIENGNRRSYRTTVRAGYEQIATLKTINFSRLSPKPKAIRRIEDREEQGRLRALLEKTYHGHAFVQFTRLFQDDGYFVLERDGQLLAGAQVLENRWALKSMGGWSGWLVVNVLPRLPFVSRVFNPRRFNFLSFEALYCHDGRIEYVYELLEGLLARFQLHLPLFWLDERSPLYQEIGRTEKQLGPFSRFTKGTDIRVMVSYANIPADEIHRIEQQPVYTSSFDFV